MTNCDDLPFRHSNQLYRQLKHNLDLFCEEHPMSVSEVVGVLELLKIEELDKIKGGNEK